MGRLVKFLFTTFSFIVALIAVGVGYLKLDNVSRQKSKSDLYGRMFEKCRILLRENVTFKTHPAVKA